MELSFREESSENVRGEEVPHVGGNRSSRYFWRLTAIRWSAQPLDVRRREIYFRLFMNQTEEMRARFFWFSEFVATSCYEHE